MKNYTCYQNIASEYLYPLQKGSEDRPLFADGYPYMMLSQSSVDSLNIVLKVNTGCLKINGDKID